MKRPGLKNVQRPARNNSTRNVMSDDHRTAVDTYLENTLLELIQAYVGRGRIYAELEIDELESRWGAAFKDWAIKAVRRQPRDPTTMDDLTAEIELRRRQPPLHLVTAEFEALCRSQDQRRRDDPKRLAKEARRLTEKLDAFLKSATKRPPN
jgi:hypothetical protein